MRAHSLSDDQIVITVCVGLAIALAFLLVKSWKRKQWIAVVPLVFLIVCLIAVIWFFATFQIRLM